MSKITYPNKATGDTFSGAEATEIKTIVNTNDDELIALSGEVDLNTAKDGITTQQATDITTNNSKLSFDEAPEDGNQYARQNAAWSTVTGGGGGDMDKTTYDPNLVEGDAFDMANMVEGVDANILTDAQSAEIAANTDKVGITPTQSSDITTNNSKVGVTNQEANTIDSEPIGNEVQVLQVVSITQADYDLITPVATTFYIISA